MRDVHLPDAPRGRRGVRQGVVGRARRSGRRTRAGSTPGRRPSSTRWRPTAVAPDLVALAGGPDAVVDAALVRLDRERSDRGGRAARSRARRRSRPSRPLEAFVAAHEALLAQHAAEHADDFENFWLIGWLRFQIARGRAERLGRARVSHVAPTADELVDVAVAETGLDDFGDWAWRDGLDVLMASIVDDAALNDAGRFVLRSWAHDRLVNRLRVVDWLRAHPERAGPAGPGTDRGRGHVADRDDDPARAARPGPGEPAADEVGGPHERPAADGGRRSRRSAHRGRGREAGGDLRDGPRAEGGALGAGRRTDRVRGAAHAVVPGPGLARALPGAGLRGVVPRLRHAARRTSTTGRRCSSCSRRHPAGGC